LPPEVFHRVPDNLLAKSVPFIQPPLLDEARKLAEAEGVALNQRINVAVAEKVSAQRTESYIADRAARANVPKAITILKRAGIEKSSSK
jgi:hypothetical protein